MVRRLEKMYQNNQDSTKKLPKVASLLRQGSFRFHTLEEAYALAHFLSETSPNTHLAVLGITEILVNALEHGNLGITFEEKSKLQLEDEWLQEIKRRLTLPEHAEQSVSVEFSKDETEITLVVTDQGKGFDWRKYQTFNAEHKLRQHGRGILVAKHFAFKAMRYSEKGNQVTCIIDAQKIE